MDRNQQYRVWRKNALMCYWWWPDDRVLYYFDVNKQRQHTTIGELRKEFVADIKANQKEYYDRLTKEGSYMQHYHEP